MRSSNKIRGFSQFESNEINDEDLLDLLGAGIALLGGYEAIKGNPRSGAQMVGLGLAAIGGRQVLKEYFESQI